jgi:hypothetical protein
MKELKSFQRLKTKIQALIILSASDKLNYAKYFIHDYRKSLNQ